MNSLRRRPSFYVPLCLALLGGLAIGFVPGTTALSQSNSTPALAGSTLTGCVGNPSASTANLRLADRAAGAAGNTGIDWCDRGDWRDRAEGRPDLPADSPGQSVRRQRPDPERYGSDHGDDAYLEF